MGCNEIKRSATFESLEWHDAATDKPDSDMTVLCWGSDGFFCGYWDDAISGWIACESGGSVLGVILWSSPEGPHQDHFPDATKMMPQKGLFNIFEHLARQREWSERTFGPGKRVNGVTDHIAKELVEVRESDGDLEEWIDVVILGLDGAWRSGATPEQIVEAIVSKQTKNEWRTWPDWRSVPEDTSIEHDRSMEDRT